MEESSLGCTLPASSYLFHNESVEGRRSSKEVLWVGRRGCFHQAEDNPSHRNNSTQCHIHHRRTGESIDEEQTDPFNQTRVPLYSPALGNILHRSEKMWASSLVWPRTRRELLRQEVGISGRRLPRDGGEPVDSLH